MRLRSYQWQINYFKIKGNRPIVASAGSYWTTVSSKTTVLATVKQSISLIDR